MEGDLSRARFEGGSVKECFRVSDVFDRFEFIWLFWWKFLEDEAQVQSFLSVVPFAYGVE